MSDEVNELLEELERIEGEVIKKQQREKMQVENCIWKEIKLVEGLLEDCVCDAKNKICEYKEKINKKLENYYNEIKNEFIDEEIKLEGKKTMEQIKKKMEKAKLVFECNYLLSKKKLIIHNELSKNINFNKLIPPYEKIKFPLRINNENDIFVKEFTMFSTMQWTFTFKKYPDEEYYSVIMELKQFSKGLKSIKVKLHRGEYTEVKQREDVNDCYGMEIRKFSPASAIQANTIYICTISIRFLTYNEYLKFKQQDISFYTFSSFENNRRSLSRSKYSSGMKLPE